MHGLSRPIISILALLCLAGAAPINAVEPGAVPARFEAYKNLANGEWVGRQLIYAVERSRGRGEGHAAAFAAWIACLNTGLRTGGAELSPATLVDRAFAGCEVQEAPAARTWTNKDQSFAALRKQLRSGLPSGVKLMRKRGEPVPQIQL